MADGTNSDGLDILVVDDNRAAAQTTGWLVESLGHRYRLAEDATTALASVQEIVPDVVLMDIGLPGMNGYDLCGQMRTLEALSETVFIAQTGYGNEQHRQRAADVGCAHFLLKPFEFTHLEAILNQVARARSMGG